MIEGLQDDTDGLYELDLTRPYRLSVMLWGRLAGWFSISVPAVVWLVVCFATRWARRTGRRGLIGE